LRDHAFDQNLCAAALVLHALFLPRTGGRRSCAWPPVKPKCARFGTREPKTAQKMRPGAEAGCAGPDDKRSSIKGTVTMGLCYTT
jgi:hypothetical protein